MNIPIGPIRAGSSSDVLIGLLGTVGGGGDSINSLTFVELPELLIINIYNRLLNSIHQYYYSRPSPSLFIR